MDFALSDFDDQSFRANLPLQPYPPSKDPAMTHRIPARTDRGRAIAVQAHPSAGFWRALPLALVLSAGWWAVGLGAVAMLAHYR